MQNETLNQISDSSSANKLTKKDYFLSASLLISAIIIAGSSIYSVYKNISKNSEQKLNTAISSINTQLSELEKKVLPSAGVVLPATWGNLGVQLTKTGTIDADKFKVIYQQRGNFTKEYEKLLSEDNPDKIKITSTNAGYLLNLFWALGLGNKNEILDAGEMMNPSYGGAQNFASTAGWTVAKGNPMDHYSRHVFFALTEEQQALVDKISRGIYRPCCDNSTHFPDCNHGMAMLGLLELMASQGTNEQEMWNAALVANSYWFPDNYLTIATYMKSKGVDWKNADPQEVLGINYSSASGYKKISSQINQQQPQRGGNACGVNT